MPATRHCITGYFCIHFPTSFLPIPVFRHSIENGSFILLFLYVFQLVTTIAFREFVKQSIKKQTSYKQYWLITEKRTDFYIISYYHKQQIISNED